MAWRGLGRVLQIGELFIFCCQAKVSSEKTFRKQRFVEEQFYNKIFYQVFLFLLLWRQEDRQCFKCVRRNPPNYLGQKCPVIFRLKSFVFYTSLCEHHFLSSPIHFFIFFGGLDCFGYTPLIMSPIYDFWGCLEDFGFEPRELDGTSSALQT